MKWKVTINEGFSFECNYIDIGKFQATFKNIYTTIAEFNTDVIHTVKIEPLMKDEPAQEKLPSLRVKTYMGPKS